MLKTLSLLESILDPGLPATSTELFPFLCHEAQSRGRDVRRLLPLIPVHPPPVGCALSLTLELRRNCLKLSDPPHLHLANGFAAASLKRMR